MTNVIMQHTTTKQTMFAFKCASTDEAIRVSDEMNRLNEEAARLTGSVIKFVYSILEIK